VDERSNRLLEAAAAIEGGATIFDALDDFLDGLDVDQRQAELDRVWLERPISHAEAKAAYPSLSDEFSLLQGDVIRTEAAFILGERRPGTYVVATATCDAVVKPKPRQKSILLLPVVSRTLATFDGRDDERRAQSAATILSTLVTFGQRRSLYLPRLPDDSGDVRFNQISFQDPGVLAADQVPIVERIASMSLIGWRAFNLLVRALITRTGEEELGFRAAVTLGRAA
jgi:hypothetical protein